MSVQKGIIIAASLLAAIIIAVVIGWFIQRPSPRDESSETLPSDDVSDVERLPVIDPGIIDTLLSDGELEVIRGDDGSYLHIEGEFTEGIVSSESDAADVLNAASSLFGDGFTADPSDLFLQSAGDGTSYGRNFFRYSPTVNDIPVLGSEIILNVNNDGVVQGVSSSYDDRINDVNTTPSVSPDRAVDTALRSYMSSYEVSDRLNTVAEEYSFDPGDLEVLFLSSLTTDEQLCIYAVDPSRPPALVWTVVLETKQDGFTDADTSFFPYVSVTYYIYANGSRAGGILSVTSNILNSTHFSISAADLNGNTRIINALQDGNIYELRDNVRNIETFSVESLDYFNFWGAVWNTVLPGTIISGATGGTPDRASVSAHANMAAVYDYYKDILGRTSFDGKSGKILLSTGYRNHVEENYGESGWLTPLSGIPQFLFGYGAEYERALDAVGHEFTHAVINHVVGNGGMVTLGDGNYRESQAGALNEAYSDIMGSLIEDKPGNERWLMYEDSAQGFVRSLSTSRHMSDWRVQHIAGSVDRWDYCCHYNSGIFSHAAYLMMTDVRTSAISYETWARVFYRSLYDLPVNATFLHARGSVLSAAEANHFSQTGKQAIKDAFDAVGIVDGFSITDSFIDVTSQFTDCVIAIRSVPNGKYVSVIQDGTSAPLHAVSDLIGTGEIFRTERVPGGYITFKSSIGGKYVSTVMSGTDAQLIADAEFNQYSEHFKIYQHGSEYYIKAPNDMWVSARMDTPDVPVQAMYDHAMAWERFDISVLERLVPETPPDTPPETTPDTDPETDTYSIATAVNNTNFGAAAANPARASQGTRVTITATPRGGFEFDRWEVDTDGVVLNNINSATATFSMPDSNVLVRAHFVPLPANDITVNVNNSNSGTAGANPASAARGVRVTLNASPRSGFEFDRWEVVSGGVTLSNVNSAAATFTMPDNAVTVRAHFRDLPIDNNIISVSANNSDFGAASANRTSAPQGTQITLTATPYSGYEFGHWEIISGGITLSNVNSATSTFSMPDNNVSVRAHFRQSAAEPRILTSVLPGGTVGQAYSQTLQASGSTPITWSIPSGNLPAGLSLNSSTGVISGTPTREDSLTFTIRAGNSTGDDFRAFSITISEPTTSEAVTAPKIPLQTIPNGTVSQAYSYTLLVSGSTPMTWALTSGVLPTGLNLNTSTGVISGTPIAPGSATITVSATNSTGSDSRSFTFTISAENTRYTITHSANNASYGSTASDVQAAVQGTRVNISATAYSGYVFNRWEVVSGGIVLSNTLSATANFIMPSSNVSVRAHFEPAATEAARYRVIVSENILGTEGDWGSIRITPEQPSPGANVQCIAVLNRGWEIIDWSVISGGVRLEHPVAITPGVAFQMPANDVHLMVFIRNTVAP